jgi:hypothetical protein
MRIRTCAVASLTFAMLAAPAFAGRSTPAEREATRQLNLDAARQAQNSNQNIHQSSNGSPQLAVADPSANLPANSPPVAAPTTPVESAGMANPNDAAPNAAVALSSVQHPPGKIASANVLDASGRTIGAVQRVDLTPEGKPTRLAVALIGKEDKLVVLNANEVKYDAAKNEILAQQSAADIRLKAGKSG